MKPKLATRSAIEEAAVRAAGRGARILTRFYETGLTARHKGEVDLVTKADLESQKAIVGVLSKAFPDHAILAEEEKFGHDRSLEGPIWVIDPLDGTTNYAHGFPMFGVSIAYRDGGETQFGLVYHPLLKELFTAHRGKGARLNGRKIAVSRTDQVHLSLLATGFPYNRRTSPENNLNLFCYFEMAAQCVRRAGAAVLDLANLSCGRFDGFWEPNLAPWDIAAGSLLVEEAGGKVTDFSGNPITDLRCGEMVASNGRLHDRLLEGIREARKFSIPNHARTTPWG
ncbi:MAG: inositol monophosphatase family protein [Pseudomonadota bacterium]